MKKLTALFLALMLVFAPVLFAATEVQEDGTRLGRVDKINFSTGVTATKSGNTATVVASSDVCTGGAITGATINSSVIGGSSPAAITGTTITGTTSMVAPMFKVSAVTSQTRPASGATAGTIITMNNVSSSTDCGVVGGSAFVVCVSDGTNWKAL